MIRHTMPHALLLLGVVTLLSQAHGQEHWPQWRGPDQNNISPATNLPTTWSDTENIVWKTPLPSWSGGSPVIWGDKVFVTSPSKSATPQETGERRREPSDPGGDELLLICIAKQDGAILWQRQLDTGNKLFRKQNNSSPSPVTDGEHVWAVAGTGAIVAFDMDGNQLWRKSLQDEYGPFGLMFGYASSPLLYEGKLIMQVLHGYTTDDPSYIVAFDALTGEVQWRVERPTDAQSESPDAYTTPTLLQHGDVTQFVISGADYVTGHDPGSGEEIWRAGGLNPKNATNYRVIASPTVADGMIYTPSRRRPVLALRAGGTGDVTASHLVWQREEYGGPDVPTPVCDGTYLYLIEDRGSILCLDAKTGEEVWEERPTQGTVSASPLLADGKIYVTNEDAVTTVVAAGGEFRLLATNTLEGGGYTLSSPAVSGSQLFIRAATHLYCIGE